MGEIIPEYYLKINSSDLITLLKRTVFCILNDSQKLEYTGAQFIVNRDVLEISATGMQRVAIYYIYNFRAFSIYSLKA